MLTKEEYENLKVGDFVVYTGTNEAWFDPGAITKITRIDPWDHNGRNMLILRSSRYGADGGFWLNEIKKYEPIRGSLKEIMDSGISLPFTVKYPQYIGINSTLEIISYDEKEGKFHVYDILNKRIQDWYGNAYKYELIPGE